MCSLGGGGKEEEREGGGEDEGRGGGGEEGVAVCVRGGDENPIGRGGFTSATVRGERGPMEGGKNKRIDESSMGGSEPTSKTEPQVKEPIYFT